MSDHNFKSLDELNELEKQGKKIKLKEIQKMTSVKRRKKSELCPNGTNEICMICLEELPSLNTNQFEEQKISPDYDLCLLKPCKHKFCFSCVKSLVLSYKKSNAKYLKIPQSHLGCPICRKKITQIWKYHCENQKEVLTIKDIENEAKRELN